jgi:hypothetical protein
LLRAALAALALAALAALVLPLAHAATALESQAAYPAGSARLDRALAANETATLQVTPRLAVAFTAGSAGGNLSISVQAAWLSAQLPSQRPQAFGALTYIEVTGAEDGIVAVTFTCLVDSAFDHDLLYWDGAAWASLSKSNGDAIPGQRGGEPLAVTSARDGGGLFVATVDHASTFALTSRVPGTGPQAASEEAAEAPGAGLPFALLGLAAAVAAVAARRGR